mmetsp:Transcript_31581/g.57405  ORF Transcript_31581/g.57405 Transcript_31581/m.57405 type:complete len:200 (-) Transcript_31581:68-667(-)
MKSSTGVEESTVSAFSWSVISLQGFSSSSTTGTSSPSSPRLTVECLCCSRFPIMESFVCNHAFITKSPIVAGFFFSCSSIFFCVSCCISLSSSLLLCLSALSLSDVVDVRVTVAITCSGAPGLKGLMSGSKEVPDSGVAPGPGLPPKVVSSSRSANSSPCAATMSGGKAPLSQVDNDARSCFSSFSCRPIHTSRRSSKS